MHYFCYDKKNLRFFHVSVESETEDSCRGNVRTIFDKINSKKAKKNALIQ